ncbi:outer membrane biogenesis protein BamB [Gemmata obscuriglobus]|nr:PQQ-binding-like beta-propeller repeat protein [Gemmata obscuriglobus]QEG27971.1 outer membrane biogenesis protein BamB [Gemmata obscuriglobus]VTS05468.1 Serine/threonine protein kinase related protein-like OS=Blastopirellula marina DSM 3645 GN=DSM3645_12486 PE=4 SV=1: PQQ_2: PQQ_2 [Gemmata obscuriglobus UQM 2246]
MRAARAFLWVLITVPALAADWPMGGRGPDRNPVSPERNAPTDWQFPTERGKPRNIRWATRIEGGYYASGGPIVAGGFVWVGTTDRLSDPKNESLDNAVLACVRASDGKVVYRYVSPRRMFPADWPGQSLTGSPLVAGERLWFCTNRREVVCLDLAPLYSAKGEPRVVWKFDMVKELKVAPKAMMIPGPETHGSPAAYKNLLYVPTGNAVDADGKTVTAPDAPSLVCLEKDTGKVVWSDASPGKDMMCDHFASPLVVEVGGKAQVIHPQADGWVRSFDARTGKLIWKFDTNPKSAPLDFTGGAEASERNAVVATPVFANGRVFFATGRAPEWGAGPGRLFCIDPTKTGDVSPELGERPKPGQPNPNSAVVWTFTGGGWRETDRMHLSLSSVAVHDGLVLAADRHGSVHCLDEKTGKRYWSHNTRASVYGSPLVADGKVYVGSDAGEVHVLELAKVKKVIARHGCDKVIESSPVFAGGVLYVLTRGNLYAVAPKR